VARGELRHLARLVETGTTYAHGAMASLPTVTLANRTAALTGRHPGHHGILHNAWYDRGRRRRIVTNSMATWPTAMQWLRPGVGTLHDAVHRASPGCGTVAVNEPCDTGADYSSFAFLRQGELIPFPERADAVPAASVEHVHASEDYAWHTMVDHLAVEQAVGIWEGSFRGVSYAAPRLCWISFALTDAAFHDGGPYSERAAASLRDTDARVGAVLAAIEQAGAFERTAFAVLADHGMEEADPAVTGDWGPALRDAGIPFRDEGVGFLYLGSDVTDVADHVSDVADGAGDGGSGPRA
jgi:predicted AlkP superfamily pyrophosphatase or phosphodiesterase